MTTTAFKQKIDFEATGRQFVVSHWHPCCFWKLGIRANVAFTLVELLVVMAIMIVMVALMTPAITGLQGASDVTKAAYDVSGALDAATHGPVIAPLSPSVRERPQPKAVLFDLDGVIVNTADFHYLAWKKIADQEEIYFDTHINERLKGVSRQQSLAIILERATRSYSEKEQEQMMQVKNDLYVEMLQTLTAENILPGIAAFLDELRVNGFKTAIVSASRNTNAILQRIGLLERFDAVVTGDHTKKSKPDPEGMLLASKLLGIAPESCVVIEDAAAGIEAAVGAGMRSIGIGDKTLLHRADYTLPSTQYLDLMKIQALY